VALVGFDADFYPVEDATVVADEMTEAARAQVATWVASVGNRLLLERLQMFEIEFLCVPLPSAETFRASFLAALGLTS
jgi:hypothetical protein